MRDEWARGLPVRVRPWGLGLFSKRDDLLLRWRVGGVEQEWIEEPLGDIEGFVTPPAYAAPPEGAAAFNLECQVVAGVKYTAQSGRMQSADLGDSYLVWRGIARRVSVLDEAAQIVRPVVSEAEDRAVINGIEPELAVGSDGTVRLRLFRSTFHFGEGREDWALGLKVEVLHEGVVVADGGLLYHMPDKRSFVHYSESHAHHELAWRVPCPSAADLRRGGWSLRLTGDAEAALEDFDRSSYWAGTVEVPVRRAARRWRWQAEDGEVE